MFIIIPCLATSTLLLTALAATSTQDGIANSCVLPNGDNGTCIPISLCAVAQQLVLLHDIQYLQKITCGFKGHIPLVCCPSSIADNPIQFNTTEATITSSSQKVPTPAPLPQRPPAAQQPVHRETTTEIRYFSEKTKTEITTPYTPNDYDYDSAMTVTENNTIHVTPVNSTTSPPFNAAAAVQSGLLPSRMDCGITGVNERIYGGASAIIDEFPWMVRLRYWNENTKKEAFGCAGSLISKQYVVTAAHCLISGDFKLVGVRLGEWDTQKDVDCDGSICSDPVLDVDIEEMRLHHKFNKRLVSRGDIALLRLKTAVNFTDFIRPICLPTSEYITGQDYLTDMTYVTAGWGRTETSTNSSVLQKVNLKAVSIDICKVAIPDLRAEDYPNVICAGGRKGQDSCAGDSGGGLVRSVSEEHQNNWYLFGITSYGLRQCGSEGIPSVYTRIVPNMGWIVNNMNL